MYHDQHHDHDHDHHDLDDNGTVSAVVPVKKINMLSYDIIKQI